MTIISDAVNIDDDAEIAPPIKIQVCYGTSSRQFLRALTVPKGISLHDAIFRSGLLEEYREIDLSQCRVGIFGKLKTPATVVRDGDRIEVYRGLIADPKDARRNRAIKTASEDDKLSLDKKTR
ncbi:RnfH family protein [Glaciimonas sp. PCH181]|uniref:RnfH family protein n=1 Tax=Glaciimonas sp. PCH181 TaxID=2133943 RepID=UPI000D3470BB|nr:RnfH family protein [Glaciimonas sp. PCH181]PUA19369.1 RnfH family protein [Glaciimonas sp. PCH181]